MTRISWLDTTIQSAINTDYIRNSMIRPTWLDMTIQSVINTNDSNKISLAIANDPNILSAIQRGLDNIPVGGRFGPSHAQNIANELIKLFGSL